MSRLFTQRGRSATPPRPNLGSQGTSRVRVNHDVVREVMAERARRAFNEGAVRYDEKGLCTRCRLPGAGFVEDGVCECLGPN